MTLLGTDEVAAGAGEPGAAVSAGSAKPRRFEFLYFAVRNKKLLLGLTVVVLFVLFARGGLIGGVDRLIVWIRAKRDKS